jgi:multidrug transporter EmrE-like cation transporter
LTALAWCAAVGGAVGYGGASVLQSVGASQATGPAVLRRPAYVAGLVCDGLAWLASLLALRTLPLFVVQSVLAGSVAVTVVLAWLFLGSRMRGRDVAAIVVMLAALVGLAAAFPAGGAVVAAGFTAWCLAGLALVAAGTAVGYSGAGSLPLAFLAGAAFSGAAVAARAVDLTAGPASLVAQPLAWAIAGYGVVGTLAYARSLERGRVGPATAVLWSVESVLAGLVGVLALGDAVRPGWAPVVLLAVPLSLVGCALLAIGPAEEALEPSAP